MALTVIEWFALVFAIGIIVKLLIVSLSPKSWYSFAKTLYRSPMVLFVVELVLALVLVYYLVQQLTFIQIMAAVALGALLTAMTFAIYARETLEWGSKLLRQPGILRRAWLPILLWLIFAVLTLLAFFD